MNGSGGADPFEDNDDDVARIAREFERKYGNAYAGKPSVSRPVDWSTDKATGYDENDDFIDNTEAYDERVPDEMEPKFGGFYINSGSLEFKQLANFERPDDAIRMPKPRKRALSTSSESSRSADESTSTAIKNPSKIVPEKKMRHDGDTKMKSKKHDKVKGNAGSDSGKDSTGSSKKILKTTTVKDMLRAKRDAARPTKSDDSEATLGSTDESNNFDSGDDAVPSEDTTKPTIAPNGADPTHRLPDNLPDPLLKAIVALIESGKILGKNSMFTDANMERLFEIDRMTRGMGGRVRHEVVLYLEDNLPCTKQTILMRTKKICIRKEEIKTEAVQKQLKEAVDFAMPTIAATYDVDCKRVLAAVDKGDQQPGKLPRKRFAWSEATRFVC